MEQVIREISTKALIAKIKRPGLVLLDVRSCDAYNGWPELNEIRGGHIAGARSLPAGWLRYIDWIEMVRHKNILPDHDIVVYGHQKTETELAANRLVRSGYRKVSVYHHYIDEWVNDLSLPVDRLQRFRNLVPAWWVKGLISGNRIPFYEQNPWVLVQAHYRNREAYLGGHIPAAIDMDTMSIEDPETWNRRTPEELKKALENHGITEDTTVVLYGKYMNPDNNDPFPGSAAGDIGAMRCALIMMYAGVKDVRILNGGFQSWQTAGYEIAFDDKPKEPVHEFGVSIPAHPEYIVDMPRAKKMLASPFAELVCVRSRAEYLGEVSGYNYIKAKGRIPGAIFADCGSDAYHMENYRHFDHTLREYQEISQIWIQNNITPDKHLAFYCGTGWRGSEAWFNAWLMGWPHVSVYDGGWFEWSSEPSNPYEIGEPTIYMAMR